MSIRNIPYHYLQLVSARTFHHALYAMHRELLSPVLHTQGLESSPSVKYSIINDVTDKTTMLAKKLKITINLDLEQMFKWKKI